MSKLHRPIIGIDLDNVISDTDNLVRSIIHEFFGIKLDQCDIVHFDYWRCGITKDQEKAVFELFHNERCAEVVPIEGAIDTVKKISSSYEVHIVTSRPPFTKEKTKAWLLENQIYYDQLDFRRDKHNSPVNYDIFIDDNRETAYNLAEIGVKSLLFDYPWNQSIEMDPLNLIRVSSWIEIDNVLINHNSHRLVKP